MLVGAAVVVAGAVDVVVGGGGGGVVDGFAVDVGDVDMDMDMDVDGDEEDSGLGNEQAACLSLKSSQIFLFPEPVDSSLDCPL